MTQLTAVIFSRRFQLASVTIGWLLLATAAGAAPADIPLRAYVYTVWAHRDGVPLGSVEDIAQTPDGYLWIAASEEGLLRFDHLEREQTTATVKGKTDRTIAGVSYWFPRQGNVSSALLVDYEQVNYDDYAPARSDERRWAVHMLVNF